MAEVFAQWNAVHGLSTGAVLEPVMWETHSRPAMGERPQEILNRQLVARCDLLVGTFWTRLGTPTGEAASGTVEEIEQFRAANKPVLLYFSSTPVVPESLDVAQYAALVEYRNSLDQQGLYSRYESHSDFRDQLQRHIAGTMIDLLERATPALTGLVNALAPAPTSESAPDPLAAQREAVREFQGEFESFLRRLRADWAAERDSDPMGTDDGKFILGRAADEVVHFRSMITEDRVGFSSVLDESARRLRAIQRHQVYLDGGVSFREFWSEGDAIIAQLATVPEILARIATEGLTRSEP